jgi:hypothetical protein
MATSAPEALQDREEFHHGREVTIECDSCPRRWYVHLQDGQRLRDEDRECPARGCDGTGREA